MLTRREFNEALSKEGVTKESARKIFEEVDLDKDDKITVSDFIAATMSKNVYMQEAKLKDAFLNLD